MGRADFPPPLFIQPGPAGWALVVWHLHDERKEIVACVRFELERLSDPPRVHARAAELRIKAPWLYRHRDLPLSRVESAANADAGVFASLLQQKDEPEPADLFAWFGNPSPPLRPEAYRYRLERPAKRRLPEDFYEQVARAYKDAVAAGLNPRKTLAADSGVPADTVARWIGEARRRGDLPATDPGRTLARRNDRDDG